MGKSVWNKSEAPVIFVSSKVVYPLKRQAKFVADDIQFYYYYYFLKKTSLDIPSESSAKQTIHMKCQDLFSLKNKKK